jgi:hypothetical protein
METAAAGTATTAAGAPSTCPPCWRRRMHHIPSQEDKAMMGGLWVLVVTVVCGVVGAGCVCAASPCVLLGSHE